MIRVTLEDLFIRGRCGPFYLGQSLEEFREKARGILTLPADLEWVSYEDGKLVSGMYDLRNPAGFGFHVDHKKPPTLRMHFIRLYLEATESDPSVSCSLDLDFEGVEDFMPISECAPILQKYGMQRIKHGDDFTLQWYSIGKRGTLYFEDFEDLEEPRITAIEVTDPTFIRQPTFIADQWNS